MNEPLGDGDANGKRGSIQKYHIDIRKLLDPNEIGSGRIENSKIIFGGKGAGKTHLLLFILNAVAKERQAFYCPITNPRMIGPVKPFKGKLRAEERIMFWSDMWRIAVNLSILSQFLARPVRIRPLQFFYRNRIAFDNESIDNKLVHSAFREYVAVEYPELDRSANHPIDPLEALDYITDRYRTNESAQTKLLHPLNISGLENDLNILLSQTKPMHFLLDGLDEYAFSDPNGWADIQYGLYRAIFQFQKRQNFGQKVFLTAALRNYMYDVIANDPQFDRAASYITKLRWSKEAAHSFLQNSLKSISKLNFARSKKLDAPEPLSNWLGFSHINIPSRGTQEKVEDYFLRHTKMSPRQIVERVNNLVQLQNNKARSGQALEESDFRRIISDGGREYGNALIKTAVEEIAVQVPEIQTTVRRVRENTGTDEPLFSYMAGVLKQLVSELGEEIVDRTLIKERLVKEFVCECLNIKPEDVTDTVAKNVEDVLWRSGVIAYRRRLGDVSSWEYCWETGASSGMFDAARKVGFHPTLIDTCELQVSPNGPVF